MRVITLILFDNPAIAIFLLLPILFIVGLALSSMRNTKAMLNCSINFSIDDVGMAIGCGNC